MEAPEHPRESDRNLIVRLQEGDLDAFEQLFEKHRRGLLAYVVGLISDRGLAEEIVQDCFVSFARSIGKIRPERGASGWLYRTARNRTIDVLRHRKFEVLPGDEFLKQEHPGDTGTPAETPIRALERKEMRDRLRARLDGLPVRERELLVARFYGGMTFKQAAQALKRPLGTVLWQARRALERLRESMDAEEWGKGNG